jgi:heterodisulfide reductase subunit A-like polyferredoxin
MSDINWIIPVAIIGGLILLFIIIKLYVMGPRNQYHPDLSGKVVIVTGGTAGIGAQCVSEFARLGAKVYLLGRN